MGGWRNAFQDAANSKPLFLTIYATVVAGIVFSSFYVFSAIYSGKSAAASASSWISSPYPSLSRQFSSCPFIYFIFLLFISHLVLSVNSSLYIEHVESPYLGHRALTLDVGKCWINLSTAVDFSVAWLTRFKNLDFFTKGIYSNESSRFELPFSSDLRKYYY